MVGVARLELTTPRSQSEYATNCATPRHNALVYTKSVYGTILLVISIFGVSGGTRTLDPQSHNLMLYQLSYTHHI